MNVIAFPRIGLSFDVNPVAIELPYIGGVHWYGIIIATGIILALCYCLRVAKRESVASENIYDTLIYSLPVAIVMARAYYVVFSWDKYKDSPIDVFKIWEGGLAIYGGIIGAIVAAITYYKIKKLPVLKMFDICCMGLLIGQAVGRWGNFVNAEAFGGYCDSFWGMSINGGMCVHPTFLYESLWNFAGLIILSRLHKKRPFYGFTFFSYITWYGVGRFFIEGLRADSLYLGGFRISQIVAFACVVSGVTALGYLSEKNINRKNKR